MLESSDAVTLTAHALARLDVALSHALLAREEHCCRPAITSTLDFDICAGRHPVVASTMPASQEFIANDCNLAREQCLWLMTGPNMAGKSTFLRQNALLALLAQIGAYIPAESATIGIVDQLFSRVGASDNLARGQSTFMVEMAETAAILNNATEKSLIILDEIGRGTATYDGLSLAWAVVEYIHHALKSRCLFATHYHELTALEKTMPSLTCHTMAVKEWKNSIVFLHQVIPGKADRSYGIHVAQLAGVPKPVLTRAQTILEELEKSDMGQATLEIVDDMPLFTSHSQQIDNQELAECENKLTTMQPAVVEIILSDLNLDDITPKKALEILYELKEKTSSR